MANAIPCSMSQKEHKMSREEIENEVNTVIHKYRILMSTEEKVCLYNAAEQSSLFSEDMVLGFYYGLQSKRKPVAVQSSLMNSKQFIEDVTKTFKSIMDPGWGLRPYTRVVPAWIALNVSEQPDGSGLKNLRWEVTFGENKQ